MNTKVLPKHLVRDAYVYLRQSSMQQVEFNTESTQRQYALSKSAKELGWKDTQIHILDEDLGKSGVTAVGRTDFNRLITAVSLNQVGAIFISELSRLGRSQADLHILLNLCALTETLVIDYDGTYNLNDPNDILLLSLKGILSHTELHTIRARMYEAKLQKARSGQLQFPLPTGYIHDVDGKIVLDPDESVVESIRLVFRLYRDLKSAGRVVDYFADNNLLIPKRRVRSNILTLEWQPLSRPRVYQILRNPIFAGVYAFGRYQSTPVIEGGQVVRTRKPEKPREEWHHIKYDNHPSYISWNEFLENEHQLALNTRSKNPNGQLATPREGLALLPGLVICGKCGRRMRPTYSTRQRPYYICSQHHNAYGTGACWATKADPIDEAVESQVLESLNLNQLNLSLAVLAEVESATERRNRQWQLNLDRADREAKRAEQQFDAVDPANRAVFTKLEKRLNEKLEQLEELKRAYDNAKKEQQLILTDTQRQQILQLAQNLPQVWKAPTTTDQERKEMLALLVKQVAITPIHKPQPQVQIKILWHTGAISELVTLCVKKPYPYTNSESTIELVRELRSDKTVSEIAQELNQRGIQTAHGQPFTIHSVNWILHRYNIRKSR